MRTLLAAPLIACGLLVALATSASADPVPILCVDTAVQGLVDLDPAGACIPVNTDHNACFDMDFGSDATVHVFLLICHAD